MNLALPLFALLSFATSCLGGDGIEAASLQQMMRQRKTQWKRVENFPVSSWRREVTDEEKRMRPLDFKIHFEAFAQEKGLAEVPAQSAGSIAAILATKDPVATLIAYEHLLEWMRSQKGGYFDIEVQREALKVVTAADPYPIEYGLIFEKSFEYAVDKGKGRGLEGNDALAFALQHYRNPEAWENLKKDRRTHLRESLEKSGYLDGDLTPAQKEFYVARQDRQNQRGEWREEIIKRGKELPSFSSDEKLRDWSVRQRAFKGEGQRSIDAVKSLTGAPLKEALASYAAMTELLQSPDHTSMELFGANREANETLAGGSALKRYLDYREAFAYATDTEWGLGLKEDSANRFAQALLMRPGDTLQLLDKHQEVFLRRMRSAKERTQLATILDDIDKELRLPLGFTKQFLGTEDESALAARLPQPNTEQKLVADGAETSGTNSKRKSDSRDRQLLIGAGIAAVTTAAVTTAVRRGRRGCQEPLRFLAPQAMRPHDTEPMDPRSFERYLAEFVEQLEEGKPVPHSPAALQRPDVFKAIDFDFPANQN